MHVLFVCTGNVFRSMTAEHALKAHLGAQPGVIVASAGTADRPGLGVRDDVAAYLRGKGLDVSSHRRRTLTPGMLAGADHVVAMHTDHRAMLRDRFGHEAPLFLELAGAAEVEMPDVDDLFAPDAHRSAAAIRHVAATIDRIVAAAPAVAARLGLR